MGRSREVLVEGGEIVAEVSGVRGWVGSRGCAGGRIVPTEKTVVGNVAKVVFAKS